MTIALPYNFDTTRSARVVCTALLASAFVILPCVTIILYTVLTPTNILVSLAPLFVAVMDIPVALLLFKKLGGVKGSISSHDVLVSADVLFGFSSSAPTGSFALNQFQCLRIKGKNYDESLMGTLALVGRSGTPSFIFYHASLENVRAHAAALAKALHLPIEDNTKAA